jgi:hypothetical protein
VKPRARFILVGAISVGTALLACNFAFPAPNATSPAPAATSSNPSAGQPPSGDPQQAVIDAFTRLENAYPYRLTETDSSVLCGQELRKTEFASQDEWHATWSGCLTGEAISTGGTTYYLVNGSWTTTGQAPPGTEQVARIAELVKAALKNVQSAGSESLNGINTNVYTLDLDDPVLNIKGGKVWIGAADGLPHQVIAPFSISGIGVTTTLVYEYGISVTIKPPVP